MGRRRPDLLGHVLQLHRKFTGHICHDRFTPAHLRRRHRRPPPQRRTPQDHRTLSFRLSGLYSHEHFERLERYAPLLIEISFSNHCFDLEAFCVESFAWKEADGRQAGEMGWLGKKSVHGILPTAKEDDR